MINDAHISKPMLATLIDAPFDDENYLFEIKWDGFRALARVDHGQVDLYSRNFKSFNEQFPSIVNELKTMKVDALFDGEIVVLDKNGKPKFQLLQNAMAHDETLYYYLFDILFLEGEDLRKLPLIERKKILKKILRKKTGDKVRFCDHIVGKGKEFFSLCVKNGLEGIIGKEKSSQYEEGKRSLKWVKIKNKMRQEVVICGFTEPRGSRKYLGALVTGIYKNHKLVYSGLVGGGFSEENLDEVKKKLSPYIQKGSPFASVPKTSGNVTWVKPHYLCEVTFQEWTSEGIMRQPIFLGLRDDKPAAKVVKEKKTEMTNLDKIYWPKEEITKGEMIAYYERMAPVILPYLKNHPQSLKRFPDGIEGESFFQKNVTYHPSWIKTVEIEHKQKITNYLLIQDKRSLLYAANLGCIELHPFLSKYQSLDFPNYLVLDLDPHEIEFREVINVARTIHKILDELKVPSYCKTSGATGLHIYIPLNAKYTYEEAKNFGHIIATLVHHQTPDNTSLERSPSQRRGKVYIDYLQNNPGQTIIAPYSLRAREGAPVSTPLEWKEVKKGLNPLDFNFYTIERRIKKKGDIFKKVLGKGIDLKK